ncbi:MAG: transglutaminase-like domain-containing protein [Candidatus Heimdallarchaeota archaeon]|nr:transglutaminase-like domain-containing protein [Candidatus Heimdallarchaeota archaeon]
MEEYLRETWFFDYNQPEIQEILNRLNLKNLDTIEKLRSIFYFVRDQFNYSVKNLSFEKDVFKASNTVLKKDSFCIPKAILLATMARAIGVPSRIHLVDFINHRLSDKLAELWGTRVMASHSYAELYINGKWVKSTPALDLTTCKNHGFIPVEFHPSDDGLLSSVDVNDNPHAEYVKDHGVYDDVPYELILKIIHSTYGHLVSKLSFEADIPTF